MGVFGSLRGSLFEGYAHSILSKGGTFSIRNLKKGGDVQKLVIPMKQREYVARFEPAKNPEAYCQPKMSNFGAVDSWEKGVGFFQMTVSLDHALKLAAIGPLVSRNSCSFTDIIQMSKAPDWPLYFVVPEDKFSQFRSQTFTKSDQQARQTKKGNESKKRRKEDVPVEWETLFDNLAQYALEIKLC